MLLCIHSLLLWTITRVWRVGIQATRSVTWIQQIHNILLQHFEQQKAHNNSTFVCVHKITIILYVQRATEHYLEARIDLR